MSEDVIDGTDWIGLIILGLGAHRNNVYAAMSQSEAAATDARTRLEESDDNHADPFFMHMQMVSRICELEASVQALSVTISVAAMALLGALSDKGVSVDAASAVAEKLERAMKGEEPEEEH